MIYKGLGFLAVVWFCSCFTTPHSPVSKLWLFLRLPVCRGLSLLRGGGGGGVQSYDGKKVNQKKLVTLTSYKLF